MEFIEILLIIRRLHCTALQMEIYLCCLRISTFTDLNDEHNILYIFFGITYLVNLLQLRCAGNSRLGCLGGTKLGCSGDPRLGYSGDSSLETRKKSPCS